MTEYPHTKFNFQQFCMTDLFEMKSEKTWTQLNALHDDDDDSNIFTLHNMDLKNSSDNFVEKYKAELRCRQNPVNKWRSLHPEDWTSSEVIDWLYYCADMNSIDCTKFKAEAFQDKLGRDLCFMDQREFQELDPIYGKQIFESFQRFLHTGSGFAFLNDSVSISTENSYSDLMCMDNFKDVEPVIENLDLINQNKTLSTDEWDSHVSTPFTFHQHHIPGTTNHVSICDSTGSESVQSSTYSSSGSSSPQYCHPYNVTSMPQIDHPSPLTEPIYGTIKQEEGVKVSKPTNDKSCAEATNLTVVTERKQARGKRSGAGSKGTHLWEFIRDLLHDEKFCPELIKWEDPNMGVFRFVRSEAVAKMWGEKKNNTSMTYEKLSRAMRYYYKRGILVRVDGRRLVYKFGPRSYGWRKICLDGKLFSAT